MLSISWTTRSSPAEMFCSADVFSGVTNHTSPSSSSDGQAWVWWLSGERYLSDCFVSSVKFSGGRIMVWGY